MPDEIGFRRVTVADRDLLAHWIARPHWQRWWGGPTAEADEIVGDTGPDFGAFIFTLDGRDAGYIQWWQPTDALEIQVPAPPETSRGIDLSIAEPADCGRGIGPRVLSAFVDRLADEGIRRFLINPVPENHAALRAYAKAGFVAEARGVDAQGPYIQMVLDLPQTAEAE